MSFVTPAPSLNNGFSSSGSLKNGGSRGQIQLILGPMFSGKSTELIRRLKRYQVAQYSCLIVKYAKDTRYDDTGIATHDRQTLKAVSATVLAQLTDKAANYDVIGIDEGQFFPDVMEWSEKMANAGKMVMIAALDGTFQRKPFANIMELVPLAEYVVKLHAVCMNCFGEGSYTKRISEDQEVEVIGGADKYMAVCRRCYHSPGAVVAVSPRIPLKHRNSETIDDDSHVPAKKLFLNGLGDTDDKAVNGVIEKENQTASAS